MLLAATVDYNHKQPSKEKNMPLREYFYSDETFIFTLSTEIVFHILQSSAWRTLGQRITSAETNNDADAEPKIDKVEVDNNTCGVDAFADLKFDITVKRILDVGGGKYDSCHNYMKSRGIDLLVWDPYNRSRMHNINIQKLVTISNVDAATSMAVLNVISELKVRLAHICTLKAALAINGIAYFKIWPGEGFLKGSYIPTVNSYGCSGYQANAYADRFLREIQLVFGLDNTKLHDTIPNLIVATKTSNDPTSKAEIDLIKGLALNEPWHLKRKYWLMQNDTSSFSTQVLEKQTLITDDSPSEIDKSRYRILCKL